jgi:hypothetical protein
MRLRVGMLFGGAAVVGALVACMSDFDKFEDTGPVTPVADASNDAADTGSSDAGNEASRSDGSVTFDAGPCRATPATCITQQGACRNACDNTRSTCDDACTGGNTGGNQFQCLQHCRRVQDDCRNGCNDTCRRCAGTCPTTDCR